MTLLLLLSLLSWQEPTSTPAIEAHVRFLADDLLEGREATFRGQKIAARYIAGHFQDIGLEPLFSDDANPYYQVFNLYKARVHPTDTKITRGDQVFVMDQDFSFHGVFPQEGSLDLEGIFIGYGYRSKKYKYNEFTDVDVTDKVVFVVDGYPPHLDEKYKDSERRREHLRSKKVKWAQKAGAKALVFLPCSDFELLERKPTDKGPGNFFSRRLSMQEVKLNGTDFPVINIAPGKASRLLGTNMEAIKTALATVKESAAPAQVPLEPLSAQLVTVYESQALPTENVLGVVPGTDPALADEYIVVTAHYDHVGFNDKGIHNGADDNASGTALIMEMASYFVKNPTRRSLIFMGMTAEEKGLLGSRFFINNPPVDLTKIVANINLDMVGRNETDTIGLIPAKNNDVTNMNKWTKEVNRKLDQPFTFLEDFDKYHHRSDHYNFVRNGIPALFFFSGDHEDYHQVTDTWDKINYDKITRVGQLVQGLVAHAGNQEERPAFVNRENEIDEKVEAEAVSHQR